RERRGERDVGEAHRAARMTLPRGAERVGASVGEGARGLMARRARLRPVAGEARVEEEAPPESDFFDRHRVVRRDARRGKARRQAPGPSRNPEKEKLCEEKSCGATSAHSSAP